LAPPFAFAAARALELVLTASVLSAEGTAMALVCCCSMARCWVGRRVAVRQLPFRDATFGH